MDNLVEIRSKPTRPRVFASRTLPLKAWDDIGVPVPTDGLVRGLLGTQSLAVLYGEPASGKTFVALDMGLHIALGREWLGPPGISGRRAVRGCGGRWRPTQ